MPAVLVQGRELGFAPKTVLDIGASFGKFTLECARVFPEARYLLVEPLAECHATLRAIARDMRSVEILPCAVGAHPGERVMHVHPDLEGSSFFLETEESDVNGVPRPVPVRTVDDIIAETGAAPPALIKIDTQGAELEVLAGAGETLRHTGMVIAEVSLFRFFHGGPLLHDVVTYMAARDFVVYDIAGALRRPLDGALAQLDLVFVRADGPFRRRHEYATREQREVQNRAFRAAQPKAPGK